MEATTETVLSAPTSPLSSTVDYVNPATTPPPSTSTNKRKRKGKDKYRPTGGFLLRTKTFFLTYPCCPLTPTEAHQQILTLVEGKGAVLKEWIVAQETHQSGDLHLHLYLKLEAPLSIKDPLFFDLISTDGMTMYHGDYRSCRSQKAVQKYVTKEGNYISNMDLTEEAREIWKPARKLARQGQMKEAVELLESKVSILLSKQPPGTCCSISTTYRQNGTKYMGLSLTSI